jgi:thiol:disulfide interchange protein DsbD
MVGVAFAGAITSLSSCTIIRLPVIWGYVTSTGPSRKRGVILSISFACGLFIVYTLFGFALGVISNLSGKLIQISHYLYLFLGVLMLVLGILFIGLIPKRTGWFQNRCEAAINHAQTKHSAFIFGVLFALLETPACPACGAVLMVIASFVIMKGSLLYSGLVFISFAIGQSIPVLTVGLSGNLFTYLLSKINLIEEVTSFVAGSILIVAGLFLVMLA